MIYIQMKHLCHLNQKQKNKIQIDFDLNTTIESIKETKGIVSNIVKKKSK